MLIRSLRLKNIKSYGEGADGEGITVRFQGGVNRVAGSNGHGKTTLIEALGYGLFFAEPNFQERFTLPTYFLRSGEKEGEIDVVFEHGGQTYRVERGLGQSKRRSKVIQVSDGSTCAMDDAEVTAFLCRLLGFKEPGQLSDLFSNLVGVKQGRLTWPFDSKPAAAKEFFEPLLDVAIFRESTSRLSETQSRFRDLLQELEMELAKLEERIRERADSAEKLPVKEVHLAALLKLVERSRTHKDEAEKLKQLWEQRQGSFNAAKSALEESKGRLNLATQKRESNQQRLNEAREAQAIIEKTAEAYQTYVKTEARLRELQQRQSERAKLQQQHTEASNVKTRLDEKKAGTQNLVKEWISQRDERSRIVETLRQQLNDETRVLAETKPQFDKFSEETARAKRSYNALRDWLETSESLEAVRMHLDAVRNYLEGGLSISPGTPEGAVKANLPVLNEPLAERELGALNQAQGELFKRVSALLKDADPKLKAHFSEFEKHSSDRVRRESELRNVQKNLDQAEIELKQTLLRAGQCQEEVAKLDTGAQEAAKRVLDLEEKLKSFITLDQDIDDHLAVKEKRADEYKSYLSVKALADKAEEREKALAAAAGHERQVDEEVKQRAGAFELAGREFDPSALGAACRSAFLAEGTLAMNVKDLQDAEKELQQERGRFKQWKEACGERDKIGDDIGRYEAASQLAKLAGKVLKDAAPRVAQDLCDRIAASAQGLFNRINHDPIRLKWNAEPQYSVRISPGERHFAMLSGGEQTKLALAMTLAMIHEFSGLRFAVFDEPTYAVDAESRQKLADAILEAQKAAGLDQLIVVSHDDAFEGKIEHVVAVRKSAAVGTELLTGT